MLYTADNGRYFDKGVKSFTVDLNTEQVIVETTLSTAQVQKMIENSGRMAILRGLGATGKSLIYLTLLEKLKSADILFLLSRRTFKN